MSRSKDNKREGSVYSYGESDLAARRLELLAEVFRSTSEAFLSDAVDFHPDLVLDLGSGLGQTTRLIADKLKAQETVGIERSARFLSIARATTSQDGVSFLEHDITQVPFPTGEPDLIYARFVLSHLPRPESTVNDWVSQLRPDGLLLLDEVDWIRTDHPVFAKYFEIMTAMMAYHGNELYIGPRLDAMRDGEGQERRLSRVLRLQPTTGQAARMFSMNLTNWRDDDFVRSNYSKEEIERLGTELEGLTESPKKGEIGWGMRQIVLARTEIG